MSDAKHIGVLLPLIFRKSFDYAIPYGMDLQIGDYVKVPFGKKSLWGVVWSQASGDIDPKKVKTIEVVAEHIPAMNENMRKLIEWVAWYSLAPLGQVLKSAMPMQEALDKVAGRKKTCNLQPATCNLPQPTTCNLSEEQQQAVDILTKKLGQGFSVSLLDGVTGSGKTEVYFDIIEKLISQGKQVLVMLPEIALSLQWLGRFEKRFGFAPDIWHSSVSKAKRRNARQKVASGEIKVIVGTRSALFLPFKDLAFIVVDEEHDASYKQEEGVIYQARDIAVVRAKIEAIPILLVSATPSLETEFNVKYKNYERIALLNRHNQAQMPKINPIDMRNEKLASGKWISKKLTTALQNTLAAGNQAMVFLNRRGYAPLLLCRGCGHRFGCPDCSSWLVLHRKNSRLLCHHCGYTATPPKQCPECNAVEKIIPYGPGVERIAEELGQLLPSARIAILTGDHVDSGEGEEKSQAKDVIEAMISGEIDILVGTQMIAKGHHFAKLALVGVVDADMGLTGGDLRAGERTYQLLHQLSGRAGREQTAGEVYLQTYMPEHHVMQALLKGGRDQFMQLEAEMREDAAMPPYGKLAAVIVEGKDEGEVTAFMRDLANAGSKMQIDSSPLILGPAPAPLTRISGKYRYRILIKASKNFPLRQWLADWLLTRTIPAKFKLKIDVEPYNFM